MWPKINKKTQKEIKLGYLSSCCCIVRVLCIFWILKHLFFRVLRLMICTWSWHHTSPSGPGPWAWTSVVPDLGEKVSLTKDTWSLLLAWPLSFQTAFACDVYPRFLALLHPSPVINSTIVSIVMGGSSGSFPAAQLGLTTGTFKKGSCGCLLPGDFWKQLDCRTKPHQHGRKELKCTP